MRRTIISFCLILIILSYSNIIEDNVILTSTYTLLSPGIVLDLVNYTYYNSVNTLDYNIFADYYPLSILLLSKLYVPTYILPKLVKFTVLYGVYILPDIYIVNKFRQDGNFYELQLSQNELIHYLHKLIWKEIIYKLFNCYPSNKSLIALIERLNLWLKQKKHTKIIINKNIIMKITPITKDNIILLLSINNIGYNDRYIQS